MPIREIKLKIRMLIEKDEGMLVAHCPEFPGLAVEAENIEELQEHTHDAIRAYLDSLIKHGDPIPVCVMESDEMYSLSNLVFRKLRDKFSFSKHPSQFIEEISYTGSNNHAAT